MIISRTYNDVNSLAKQLTGNKHMNSLAIFVVRLILGLVFGILLTRLFKPDWEIYHGALIGLVLVGLAYGMAFFRKK
jgi:hypothetical protein